MLGTRRSRRDQPRESRSEVVHNSFLFQAALFDCRRLSAENKQLTADNASLRAEVRRLSGLLGFPLPDTEVRS